MARKYLKNNAFQDITDIIVTNGGSAKQFRALRDEKYSGVPESTWYRWVRTVKDSGVTAKLSALRVKRKAGGRATANDVDASVAKEAVKHLPVKVTPDDIIPSGFLKVMDQIQLCMLRAEKVVQHCEADSGKIRNPKLYLQASRHILDAMKTASYISNQLMEAQRVEQFHQAILNRLKERDPIFVEEILEDLERLNQEWGIV
jgi:hypothetical protein